MYIRRDKKTPPSSGGAGIILLDQLACSLLVLVEGVEEDVVVSAGFSHTTIELYTTLVISFELYTILVT